MHGTRLLWIGCVVRGFLVHCYAFIGFIWVFMWLLYTLKNKGSSLESMFLWRASLWNLSIPQKVLYGKSFFRLLKFLKMAFLNTVHWKVLWGIIIKKCLFSWHYWENPLLNPAFSNLQMTVCRILVNKALMCLWWVSRLCCACLRPEWPLLQIKWQG